MISDVKKTVIEDLDSLKEFSFKDEEDSLNLCVQKHKSIFPGDFYVVILTRQDKVIEENNIIDNKIQIRSQYIAKVACPTPNYDQAVFKYHKNDDRLEFLWVIPDRDTAFLLKNYALQVDKSERDLLNFVLKFADGSLYKLAKKLNGEKEDSGELEGRKSNREMIESGEIDYGRIK